METIVIHKLEHESLMAKSILAVKLEEQVKILLNENKFMLALIYIKKFIPKFCF